MFVDDEFGQELVETRALIDDADAVLGQWEEVVQRKQHDTMGPQDEARVTEALALVKAGKEHVRAMLVELLPFTVAGAREFTRADRDVLADPANRLEECLADLEELFGPLPEGDGGLPAGA